MKGVREKGREGNREGDKERAKQRKKRAVTETQKRETEIRDLKTFLGQGSCHSYCIVRNGWTSKVFLYLKPAQERFLLLVFQRLCVIMRLTEEF